MKTKNRLNFILGKANTFLFNMWLAMETSRRSFSHSIKYYDAASVWGYQYLEKQGCIINCKNKSGKYFWKLTTKGMNLAELLAFKLGYGPRWDKRWRILVFDVPQNRNTHRNFLRRKLKELGFYKMQQSVWVTPYPIPKSFAWFLKQYSLSGCVRFMVVEEINYDADIKKFFKL